MASLKNTYAERLSDVQKHKRGILHSYVKVFRFEDHPYSDEYIQNMVRHYIRNNDYKDYCYTVEVQTCYDKQLMKVVCNFYRDQYSADRYILQNYIFFRSELSLYKYLN
jgi:hypothetical protein